MNNNNNVSSAYNDFDKEQYSSSIMIHNQPLSPPDLEHDSEEDDEDSLCTPSLSPKQGYKDQELLSNHRRKSIPHRSPAIVQDTFFDNDKSIVFQLDIKCTSKIICGQSLLTSLRKRVIAVPPTPNSVSRRRKRARTASIIEIPRSQHRRTSAVSSSDHSEDDDDDDSLSSSSSPIIVAPKARKWVENDHQQTKPVRRQSNQASSSSGRPSRVKGPCQACQEPADGCMRKAFHWPFHTTQSFNDKGKPFVYLCNKCGLRYNKSGGCVCRHCRWVFCKEEKRKALQYIDAMRRRRPDGHVDPNEEIENFVCSPKYWVCGKPWKVGWVLNNNQDGDEDDSISSPNTTSF